MYIVLPADPADGRAVIAITQRIHAFTPEEQNCVKELWDDYVAKGLKSPYRFCVCRNRVNDVVNGFACYGKRALTASTYDLYWIVVDPYEQRSGVGSELLMYVEQHIAALNGRQLLIETSSTPDYQNARRFYKRHHYRRIAVLRDFYAPGDDLIIYSKTLKYSGSASLQSHGADDVVIKPDLQIGWSQKKYS